MKNGEKTGVTFATPVFSGNFIFFFL